LVKELVLVLDFSLSQPLLGVLLLLAQSRVEALLLGVVELLQLRQLGLRVGIDLSDSILLGSFLLLKELVTLA
jgi:hypothetical protein